MQLGRTRVFIACHLCPFVCMGTHACQRLTVSGNDAALGYICIKNTRALPKNIKTDDSESQGQEEAAYATTE